MTLPKKIRIIKEIPGVEWQVGEVVEPSTTYIGDHPGWKHWHKEAYDILYLALEAGYAVDADKRWKPKAGEEYFIMDSKGYISSLSWVGDALDENRYEFGNVFQTPEEATTYRDKIKKLLIERI